MTVKQKKYVREKNKDESSYEESGVEDRESVAIFCRDNCYPEKQRALIRNIWSILESLQSEFNDYNNQKTYIDTIGRRELSFLVRCSNENFFGIEKTQKESYEPFLMWNNIFKCQLK